MALNWLRQYPTSRKLGLDWNLYEDTFCVSGEIRSGHTERVVLLAIVWIKCLGECPFYSWMNVLSMNHIISSTVGRSVVKACLVGRSSVVVVQIKANANKHRTHADTSDALSKMRGSGRAHDDGDE